MKLTPGASAFILLVVTGLYACGAKTIVGAIQGGFVTVMFGLIVLAFTTKPGGAK
jgi:hypothetical protein